MSARLAYVALGANGGAPAHAIGSALQALEARAIRVAACARLFVGPYVDADGRARTDVPPVWNTVAEIRTTHAPAQLLAVLRELERAGGRRRDDPREREIDLDLLAYEDRVQADAELVIPHPRCLERAFVLRPWAEIAPLFVVPGTGTPVAAHADALTRPGADGLAPAAPAPLPAGSGAVQQLADADALSAWREAAPGPVGLVPTMGALHDGHLALVRRARAECASVLVTLFVNPLQFGPDEDLERYPRALDADCDALGRLGVDAVYVPAPEDLYRPGFATYVDPRGAADGYEGAVRPGHFRGVATVVAKLWQRTRPDRSYFGRKDAQQVAVLNQLHRDLDFDGTVVVCPTVYDVDGLALSSRNRYLDEASRARALLLPRALAVMAQQAAGGEMDTRVLVQAGRAVLHDAALPCDYLDTVDPERMTPVERLDRPVLAVGAIRIGDTRLLDNRWLVPPRGPR